MEKGIAVFAFVFTAMLFLVFLSLTADDREKHCHSCGKFTKSLYYEVRELQKKGKKLSPPFDKPIGWEMRRFCGTCRYSY